MHNSLTALLTQVRDGSISVADAALQLREAPFEDLGYARVDHHRRLRQGAAEVIYGAGKTPEQIAGIVDSLQRSGQKTVLITRMKPEAAAYLQERAALTYDAASRIGIVGPLPEPDGDGKSSSRPAVRATFPSPRRQRSQPRCSETASCGCMTSAWPGCTVCSPVWTS